MLLYTCRKSLIRHVLLLHARLVNLLPSQPATTRGQSYHLDADRAKNKLIYTSGRNVYIRDLQSPQLASVYSEHNCAATVARLSPSGYYVASGDMHGNVRVWDATQPTAVLKYTGRALSGTVRDLAWDGESQRILVGGDGKERFGHVFLAESGSSVGEIIGHAKPINAVSLRPQRPFRAVTASDDLSVNFYMGVPYKYALSNKTHSRFVQDVRFAIDGSLFASVASDGKLVFYDGALGTVRAELEPKSEAKPGMMALSWSADGTQILTSAADGTASIWDVSTGKIVQTFELSSRCGAEHQQVGNVWCNEFLVSLSLSGALNYLDPRSGKHRTVDGHVKGITSLTAACDATTFYTGSYDGRACVWDLENLNAGGVKLQGSHENQIVAMGRPAASSGSIYTVSLDDTLGMADASTLTFAEPKVKLGMSVKAASLAACDDPSSQLLWTVSESRVAALFLPANRRLEVLVDEASLVPAGASLTSLATCSAVSPGGSMIVAIGRSDAKVLLFDAALSLESGSVRLAQRGKPLEGNKGSITALAFSPNTCWLAAGDAGRYIIVYDVATGERKISQWGYHNAKVNCLAWGPSSALLASGSLDTSIIIWSMNTPTKRITLSNAHIDSVNQVGFVGQDRLLSCGQDGSIRHWKLEVAP